MTYPEVRDEDSTSETVRAYRALARAMPDHLEVEAFSFAVGSPEHIIYTAVFASTATHRKGASGEWGLAPPTAPDWRAAWESMTDQFDRATDARVNLVDIAQRMSGQVIGANDGNLRLLLIAGLLMRREDVILYEDHNLVTSLDGATAVRLFESINAFSIKNTQTRDGQRSGLLNILTRRLQLTINTGDSTLLAVVIALYRQFQAMPPYAQQTTRSLSRDTLAIRQCFRGASEPDILLFETLPIILMIEPFSGSSRLSSVAAGEYTTGIFKAIRELQSAYPILLENIRQLLTQALSADSTALRDDLTVKARAIANRTISAELAPLLEALMSSGNDDQWLEAIASTTTGGAPPRTWDDDMVDNFSIQLNHLGSIFHEALASR